MIDNVYTEYEDVLAWAKSKDEDTILHNNTGPDICTECFFANYYREYFAVPMSMGYNYVGPMDYAHVVNDITSYKVPQWVTNAVPTFEALGEIRDELTAEDCVKILENLKDKG